MNSSAAEKPPGCVGEIFSRNSVAGIRVLFLLGTRADFCSPKTHAFRAYLVLRETNLDCFTLYSKALLLYFTMQDMTSERTTLLSPTDTSSIVDKLDEVDLCLLLLLLQILEGNLIVLRANLEAALDHIRKDELAAQRAKPNVPAQRRSFNAIAGVLSPIHFRRMFRMNRASFDRLCKCIISKVGDDAVFKSQEWLDSCSRDNEEATTRTSKFKEEDAICNQCIGRHSIRGSKSCCYASSHGWR